MSGRRHFRCIYDLAERVYPDGPAASLTEYHDSWLLTGLSGCGIAPERHLVNYFTAPALNAAERRRVIARNLRKKRIVEVDVEGLRGPCYARPEHLEAIDRLPEPAGTTLICPFDSLLWQRKRAAELLDFDYAVEIYVPPRSGSTATTCCRSFTTGASWGDSTRSSTGTAGCSRSGLSTWSPTVRWARTSG